MSKTHIQVDGERFLINGKLTYSEIEAAIPIHMVF